MTTATVSIEHGVAHHRAGELAAAEAVYRQVLAANPKNAEAWYLLGVIAHRVGKDSAALECFDRAIALAGNVSAYHFKRGEALATVGRVHEALAAADRAIQLNPEFAEAHALLAELYEKSGKSTDAELHRKQARELGRHSETNVSASGGALATLMAKLRQAIAVFPDVDQAEAISLCRNAFLADPRCAEAHVLTGLIDAAAGRLSVAEAAFRSALQIDPNCAEASRALSQIKTAGREAAADSYVQIYLRDRLLHMDYPRCVGIETLGHCNAKCTFCPHSDLERNKTKMSDALFEKILHDLGEIPRDQPIIIVPNGINEPLLDPRLIERLSAINRVLPQATILIFTAFNIVPESFFEGIWSIQNLMGINVSLNAANPDEYRSMMSLDLEKTVGHLRRFLAENRRRRFLKSPMMLTRVGDESERDERYVRECHAIFSEFEHGREYDVRVKQRINWLGNTKDRQSPILYSMPCTAWLDLTIHCNGTVPLCCADATAKYKIGDANQSSILEIYNSQPFKELREKMASRETVTPCNTCSLLQ